MADRFEVAGSFREPAASTAKALAAASSRSRESVVYVDVGAKRIDSNITRDGVPIGVHRIDPDALKDAIIDRPILALRIVDQSVAPGTPVPVGTAVEIVMAPAAQLKIGVIAGVHVGLKDMLIGEGFEELVRGRSEINRIVTHAAAGQLTGEDETAVRTLFAAKEIPITDEPGRDVTSAVEALRVLTTFGR